MIFKPFSIGKYEFVELLGRGGMAEVYRVRLTGEKGFEKEFAIKRVLSGFITEPRIVRMFEEEARLTSILTHANIVQTFEFIKSSGNYFLVMEYIKGKNLASTLRYLKGKGEHLRLDIALYIINEVCKGLHYAHTKKDPKTGLSLNIIHRDISPQNIMLSYEGDVKLVDFGIAKAMDDHKETKTGQISGKISYMSPEQSRGKPLDLRSDIFSLCLVLYELVTHKKLFDGSNEFEVLHLVQHFTSKNLHDDIADIPPEIGQILIKGLSPLKEERFQNVSEMQEYLQQYLSIHYPQMNQWRFSDWINENCNLLSAFETNSKMEITPMSLGEERLMQDALSKLELAFQNDSIPSVKPLPEIILIPPLPERPQLEIKPVFGDTPREFNFVTPLAVSIGLIVLIGLGIVIKSRFNRPVTPPVPEVASVNAQQFPGSPLKTKPQPTTPSSSEERKVATESLPTPTPAPSSISAFTKTDGGLPLASPKPKESAAPSPTPKMQKDLLPTPVTSPRIQDPKAEITEELSAFLQAQRDYERGVAALEKTPSTPSEVFKKLYEAGMEAYKNGQYDEAIKHFHRSRTFKSSYLPAWLYEIMSLEAAGKRTKAKEVASTLLRLHPETKNSEVLQPYLPKP